ncbi:RtcB family protein [Deferrisoma camini]|uniref:RtcB family protein n=1 Tax=Deferrisoma camini TaxID=1035120 RepID=UPI00046D3D63|nr:RtcB family protein [Deferrisoma camini]
MSEGSELRRIDEYRWEIPRQGTMRVPGVIYASEEMIGHIRSERAPEQVRNVATLPGILKASMAMPDVHWGYGFPIGGVAGMDAEEGVVSPGGVGYDINCGCRLMTTHLTVSEVRPRLRDLVGFLFSRIPSGVGSTGAIRLSRKDERGVLVQGARWTVEVGYGWPEDLEATEEEGCLEGADPDAVSPRAYERGFNQVGTLGSGNHFLEVQYVERIFDPEAAEAFGLAEGQVTVMIHSGSRGFGYQVCDDYLKVMAREVAREGLELPDRQLACAFLRSDAARKYLGAMAAAANYAWANRQALMHWTREALLDFFGASPRDLGLRLLYDVAHNIAKSELHVVDGRERWVLVHRKGATRAFGPGDPRVPARYRAVGQPVLIPGDMGRASYILRGTAKAMEETFGSTCHGAGRVLSRKAALKRKRGAQVRRDLEQQGIFVFSAGTKTLAEEMPEAYKDVDEVVGVVDGAGISRKVARLRPLGVVKG